jgi:hypothetical protein
MFNDVPDVDHVVANHHASKQLETAQLSNLALS